MQITKAASTLVGVLARRSTPLAQHGDREDGLARFLQEAAVAILLVTAEGGIADANPAALALLDRGRHEVVGRGVAELHVDVAAAADVLARLGAGNPVRGGMLRVRRADGGVHTVHVDANPVDGPADARSCWFLHAASPPRRGSAALEDDEAGLRLALEAARAGAWEWDLTTGRVRWSDESYRLFGQEPGSFEPRIDMGTPFLEPDDRARAAAAIRAVLEDGADLDVEYPMGRNVEQRRWLQVRGRLCRDADGRPRRLVGIITDVTAEKQAALERDALLATAERASAAAETANRQKDEFLAVLSHELRTPLTAMLSWLRILERHGRRDAALFDRATAVLDRNVRAQTQLINDLLDVSRIVSGKLTMDREPVDLACVVAACVDALRPDAAGKDVALALDLDGDALVVDGDRVRLQQAVANVMGNALKFTPAGGGVAVRAAAVDGHAIVEVADTGCGIAPEFLPHVFDRFQQADSSSVREHGGLGIGLAIVHHVVERHGGTVTAASAGVDRGATFTLTVPLAQDPVARPGLRDADAAEAPTAVARVLLVDDDPDTREAFGLLFERSGATVDLAGSVAEALARVAVARPDVVVTDLSMPGTDGWVLLSRLRWLLGRRVPVIALTGHAGPDDRARALDAGFDDHIAKPVEPAALLRRITMLVTRRRALPERTEGC